MENKTQKDYNRERQEEILLGQSMNQANIMLSKFHDLPNKDLEELYKELVRSYFKWNKELRQEYEEGKF